MARVIKYVRIPMKCHNHKAQQPGCTKNKERWHTNIDKTNATSETTDVKRKYVIEKPLWTVSRKKLLWIGFNRFCSRETSPISPDANLTHTHTHTHTHTQRKQSLQSFRKTTTMLTLQQGNWKQQPYSGSPPCYNYYKDDEHQIYAWEWTVV